MLFRVAAFLMISIFYILYFLKMIIQKSEGIQTNQFCRGNKNNRELVLDLFVQFSTVAVLPVEIFSILSNSAGFKMAGLLLQFFGTVIFAVSLKEIKESWRVGFSEEQKTELITDGIYSFSRNPAFVGFDLMYIGVLTGYFNILNLIFTIMAVAALHIQIKREEKFLTEMFGKEYQEYCKRVKRYL